MRIRPSFLALPLLAALAACQPIAPSTFPATSLGMEMFTPTKMRLHPLSRIIPASSTLEARIELTDQFGDIGKGAGTLSFKLFSYSSLMPNHQGSTLQQWPADLTSPDTNHQHWDPITRTYLFKLPLKPNSLDNLGRIQLLATFTLPDGTSLTDSLTLPTK